LIRYPEQEVEPYIRDLIFGAAGNRTRLFLSHMTSTTHHPWKVPATWKKENYVGRNLLSKDTDLNDYLNSVGYVDEWLGRILGLLDEAGIANSTLVVVVGDQ
jgi:phosphoglycerol transferase MdoB-like AlkP superfamily enzyme